MKGAWFDTIWDRSGCLALRREVGAVAIQGLGFGNVAGGKVAILMAIAPLLPNFLTCGELYGPDAAYGAIAFGPQTRDRASLRGLGSLLNSITLRYTKIVCVAPSLRGVIFLRASQKVYCI